MNKFRVNKPVTNLQGNQEIELQHFKEGAERRETNKTSLNKDGKPLKSFTIPLNEYELELLRQSAKKDNRSQRYIARLLLVKSMREYLKETS